MSEVKKYLIAWGALATLCFYGGMMADDMSWYNVVFISIVATACVVWPWYALGLFVRGLADFWRRLPRDLQFRISSTIGFLLILALIWMFPGFVSGVFEFVLIVLIALWNWIHSILDRLFSPFVIIILLLYGIYLNLGKLVDKRKETSSSRGD
jgi:hypothetical protein